MTNVSRSVEIAASPTRVWELVSDLPRMGEYSPENTGGRWVRGGGPVVGAVLRGTNRRGRRRWMTWATVTVAEPGRAFAFRVHAGPVTTTLWRYVIEPSEGGCRVTETWEDRRSPVIKRLGDLYCGDADRPGFTERSIEQTLARIKQRAEGA